MKIFFNDTPGQTFVGVIRDKDGNYYNPVSGFIAFDVTEWEINGGYQNIVTEPGKPGAYEMAVPTISTLFPPGLYMADFYLASAALENDLPVFSTAFEVRGDNQEAQAGLTMHSGVTQAGSTVTTVVLASAAVAIADSYVGSVIAITSGTGRNQIAFITAYNTGTKTVTLDRTLTTAPGTGAGYVIFPVPSILGTTVETGVTFKTWLRRAGAAMFGITTNGQTKFRDQANAVNRISATINTSGDRTAITFDDT